LAKVDSTTTKEEIMSKETHRSDTRPASTSYAEANPQLYSFLDWMAQQDPEYSQAFRQYAEAGTEEGRALSIKYREMIMTAVLVFAGRREGAEAHLKRAIEHGATKRELFEAGQSAAVPGGGITLGLWMQILTQFDREGAFKNG
jgi:alkylhydroperoxidase/carboxymuconolactone decarboxylase family protein YurZ